MGLHQTKKFLHSRENHQQNKRQPTEWENIFANTYDKYTKFIKNLQNSTPKIKTT